MAAKKHPRRGSTLDSFLEAEGVKEAFQAVAIKEVIAWQLAKAMERRKLSKNRMATLMRTSRAQLDRLLDPERDVTLGSLQRAAHVLGCRVRVELG
jgi:predicted XRE-type DNA-binding protein